MEFHHPCASLPTKQPEREDTPCLHFAVCHAVYSHASCTHWSCCCWIGAEVELSNGKRLRCKAVVAADGAKSRVAATLGMKPAAYAGEVYYRLAS